MPIDRDSLDKILGWAEGSLFHLTSRPADELRLRGLEPGDPASSRYGDALRHRPGCVYLYVPRRVARITIDTWERAVWVDVRDLDLDAFVIDEDRALNWLGETREQRDKRYVGDFERLPEYHALPEWLRQRDLDPVVPPGASGGVWMDDQHVDTPHNVLVSASGGSLAFRGTIPWRYCEGPVEERQFGLKQYLRR